MVNMGIRLFLTAWEDYDKYTENKKITQQRIKIPAPSLSLSSLKKYNFLRNKFPIKITLPQLSCIDKARDKFIENEL